MNITPENLQRACDSLVNFSGLFAEIVRRLQDTEEELKETKSELVGTKVELKATKDELEVKRHWLKETKQKLEVTEKELSVAGWKNRQNLILINSLKRNSELSKD